jgi:Uma2 family endonuclease
MTVATVPRQATIPSTGHRAKLITGEALLAMGDIGPCELIDGRIVPMVPTGNEHGVVEFNLGRHIGNFVAAHKLGWVSGGEVGIYTRRNPDRVRGADIAFVSRERLPGRLPKGFLTIAPDLVVEVVSPDDRWQGIRDKLEEYFAIGVHRVWIVEPETHTVLVYRSVADMSKLGEDDTLTGEGVLDGFTLPVAELFAE